MRKDTRKNIVYAHTPSTERDVPVEPKQSMSVTDMFIAMVNGYDIPEKISNGYDEDITIDEVGYSAQDTLEGMDYLKAVNQRINLAKIQSETAAEAATITETSVTDNVTE